MSTAISSQLNQHYRSALLAYYIGQYAPSDDTLKNIIETPEDVYEYLLIDPLVTNDVTTSRVAQAMSSVQQYINGITLNMEPGYDVATLDPDQIAQWNKGADQYAIWAGEVELDAYPEDYIDPTLRTSKTTYFKDLETILNQNQTNSDTAQNAVLNYLNEFEQVANLEMVSGYMDGTDETQSIYYFLGRTRSIPYQYYWRSLNMADNINNVISSGGWSEWQEIDLPLNDDTVIASVRPAFYNNRLYVAWFTRTVSGDDSTGATKLSANISYLRYDNTWSVVQCIDSVRSDDEVRVDINGDDPEKISPEIFSDSQIGNLCTLFMYYNDGTSSDKLYSSIFMENDDGEFKSYNASLDNWGNLCPVESDLLVGYFGLFIGDGKNIIQYQGGENFEITVSSVTQAADSVDYKGITNFIPKMEFSDVVYDVNGDIVVTMVQDNALSTCFQKYSIDFCSADQQSPEKWPLNSTLYFDFSYSSVALSGSLHDHCTSSDELSAFYLQCQSTEEYTISISLSPYIHAQVYDVGEWAFSFDLTGYSAGQSTPFVLSNDSNSYLPSWFYSGDAERFSNDAGPLEIVGDYEYNLYVYIDEIDESNIIHQQLNIDFNGEVDFSFTYEPTDIDTVSRFIYGIEQVTDGSSHFSYRTYDVKLQEYSSNNSPCIKSINDEQYGSAVYLYFTSNALESIRLNTLFAKELINKASVSIDDLLTWETQETLEPSLTSGGDPVPMDFNGANGLYFWELFFHMPFLVAWRLNQEQQYDDAQRWYNYIFDPSGYIDAGDKYWNVRPLVEGRAAETAGGLAMAPTDPDAIATADPIHYQKAVFMAYVNNIIAAGDAAYRLLTSDGLGLAKLRYCQARDLLGPRPDVQIVNRWQIDSLANVAAGETSSLEQFELRHGDNLYAFKGEQHLGLSVMDNNNFLLPLNTQLLNIWNLIDSRLYNLRHNLSIDGLPINVPLYATPVNPTMLIQQSAAGGSLTSANAELSTTIPPYRFRTMLQSASGAVGTLSQLGQTLLSYYERGDSTALQELQQQQMLDVSSFTLSLQQQAIDALYADQSALLASQQIAQQRYDHYYQLYQNGVSSSEQQAMDMQTQSGELTTSAQPFLTSGAALNMMPNVAGTSVGGMILGASLTVEGVNLQLEGEAIAVSAQRIAASEQYRRRSEEWQIQYQQAQAEVTAIGKQLDALTIRQQAAQTSLDLAKAQQANLQTTLSFLSSRFSKSSLYTWLTGQLSALYYQAYDAVVSLCLSTEACWQYEMGDVASRFIQTSSWNDSYHGLLVGETLQLNLQMMEAAWLNRNQRRLELTKTVSLKELLGDIDFATLKSTGTATFTLNEATFDEDYPGHYLRQLKFLTVSLPTLLGPYQDVRATLTQSGSSTLLKADIAGVKYLNGDTSGSTANVLTNPRASQQIAISTGLNDSGMFELNFGDERYLPFEGTGAVSEWQLSFPQPTSTEQASLLAALNDVIIQVHYTAVYGGPTFERAVIETLPH
jgi:hypothetical protein